MTAPLEVPIVAQQQLSAPNAAVRPKSKTVQDDPRHWPAIKRPAILGQARREMCVVVLHLDQGTLPCPGSSML